MRGSRLVPWVLLVGGVVTVADAVLRGGASVSLVVVVPVVTGRSVEFLAGMGLLILGFLSVAALAVDPAEPSDPDLDDPLPPAAVAEGGGGVVLLGPVPIFFGGWRAVSRRTRWWVALAAAVATAALVAFALLAFR